MSKSPIPSLATVPVTPPPEPATLPPAAPLPAVPPVVVQRESLHVRLPVATVERVREAAHRLRRERQEIADEALREWLDKHGL